MEGDSMNVGSLDRIFRTVLGLTLFIAALVTNTYGGFAGFLLIFSGVFGYCPFYTYMGIDTCFEKESK